MKNEVIISNKIYTIRNQQVMLDRDLAELYCVKARRLREQVKRNIERFPGDFMFQLSKNEVELMVSQNAIPSIKHLGGTNPYVFTAEGVAMLAGVLRSPKAVQSNILIMRAFVAMRRFLTENAEVFQRLGKAEAKLLQHDNSIKQVFNAIEEKDIKPSKGIFFDGKVFDAYNFVSNLIKSAKKSIILIDNYIDENTLSLFTKNQKVEVTIYTRLSRQLSLDLEKYNSQYKPITIKNFTKSHDRFLIIDEKEVYHIGASLKDLGKKWFAFSKFESSSLSEKIKKEF